MSPIAASPCAEAPSAVTHFRERIASLTRQIAGKPLDANLDAWLNQEHGAGSASYPTVTNGHALVLYLLPNGRIEFTAAA